MQCESARIILAEKDGIIPLAHQQQIAKQFQRQIKGTKTTTLRAGRAVTGMRRPHFFSFFSFIFLVMSMGVLQKPQGKRSTSTPATFFRLKGTAASPFLAQ